METNTHSNHTDLCTSGTEGGHYYTCPLGESNLDSDTVTNSGNAGNYDHLQNPTSSGIPTESESCCLGIRAPILITTDVSSTLPTVNSNVNPLFASQPDKRGLCGGEEQTQTPRNASNQCDMEQEEMGTENNMWKLRANRVKQILSALNKEFRGFHRSKKVGLEFNVGFARKQNISVDSLTNAVLLELAKFALAINSSQQDFIMEILEHNFDFSLQSQQHRNIFTCEIMKRVRNLRSCEDAVKFSNDVFELSGPMPSKHISNQSVCSVNPELSSASSMEECDVAPTCRPHSHADTKEHISQNSVDLYPFCKEIGLKLHVNNSLPNKKLDINKLTNGVMTEVSNFAEKLCGTFEEICLDILRHNFDLDLQSGDSELARNILARIPALMEQRNLSTCVKPCKKIKGKRRKISTMAKLDCQNNPNLDACGAGSSQAAIIDQNVGSSPDSEHQNELNLKLWKLRANHIQHILSIPHGEHCPLYSYSRCKKAGIDFNVGSGVKLNLDPKLLTNGIMVEINTFATALQSATKHFVTEILEYNFNLNLKNELDRSAFAEQTMAKIRLNARKRISTPRLNMVFELPDTRCIQEPTYDKTTYCPKCYQDRNHKLCQDESDPGHMHHPSKDQFSTFSTTETIMDSYPRCKKIGLNLCVDKDQPKDKLDTHVLTRAIMNEVASFAKKLCGTKSKIIKAVLEHNFNIGMQCQDIDPADLFRRATARKDGGLAWFSEVFVIQPFSHRQPGYVSKLKREAAMYRSEKKETIKKRKLALQRKEQRAKLPSHNISDIKSKTNHQSRGNCYPICTEIGLDLDVTSKSGEKEKLGLQLLTRAVVMEIHKFATQQVGHYFPRTVYDILDYNFDLSSQHCRHLEFSIATASKVQAMVKQYRKTRDRGDEVFQLPFVFAPKASQRFVEKRHNKKWKKYSCKEPDKKMNEGSFVRQVRCYLDINCVHFLDGVKTSEESWFCDEDTKTPTDPGTIVQKNGSLVSVGCGNSLQGNIEIKEEEYDPHYDDVKPEPDTEEKYHPHYDDVKTESNTEDVEHLVPGGPAGSLRYTFITMCPNSESNIKTESVNEGVKYYILAEPQGSEGHAMLAVCPNTESNIKTGSDIEGVKYLVPVEAAASQGYSITIGQGNESALIKEEQENIPADSYHYGAVSYTEREEGIKQELDP
ncbi:uncharacterized protein LOC122863372 isoform X2 [Siniperca chuatsi]|uniref:uncharacterized protein LOC122863372 isoform X2 n=1 Tax=Siniperca chuatsi TaxID=119488 RepID=UPI001CE13982|nr:uncharacterized protein LOC122863372 isoform X2 [Siniperca chuatsi]